MMQFTYTQLSSFFIFNSLLTFGAVSGQFCLTEFSRCQLAAATSGTDADILCGPTGSIRECSKILRQSCSEGPYKVYGTVIADYYDYSCTPEFGNDVVELVQCEAYSTCSDEKIRAIGQVTNLCRLEDDYEQCLRTGGCSSNALRYATKTGALQRIACGDNGSTGGGSGSSVIKAACRDQFTATVNRFAYGGILNSATSNPACALACETSTPRCYGYDWTNDNKCYLNFRANALNYLQTANGVTNYRRIFVCTSPNSTPSPTEPGFCEDPFFAFLEQATTGGDRQVLATELHDRFHLHCTFVVLPVMLLGVFIGRAIQ